MSFAALREHKLLFTITLLAIAVPGLFLGPAIMTPAYRIVQPVLSGMTLLGLEIIFALIIDFPLAFLTSAVICRVTRTREVADGALAGAMFLLVFGVLIVASGPLKELGGVFYSLALEEAFPLAMTTAREQLGAGTLGIMMALYGVFDFGLCTLAGIAGFHWANAFRRAG